MHLLAADYYVSISSWNPFNSNFNLLNVNFMFKEMSWFVKNAFNNVYPCISKIWNVSKLKLLITCHEFKLSYSRIASAHFQNCEVRSQAPTYLCEWNFGPNTMHFLSSIFYTGLFLWQIAVITVNFRVAGSIMSVLQYERKFRIEIYLVLIHRTKY